MVFFKNLENRCKKRDRKATERAILLAASKLFAEKGYENTRTLDIAKEACANEALITRYFGGKEGLLASVMKNEEALQIVLDKKDACGSSRLEEFPTFAETGNLKTGFETFFTNGMKSIEIKEAFMRIGASRCLVDPEMADVIRNNILNRHMPLISHNLKTYPELKKKKQGELDSLSMLLLTANFNLNFQIRKIYRLEPKLVDRALNILVDSFVALYSEIN